MASAKVAVILVAGVGQRLRPITDDRPKALVPVGKETMLDRAVRLLTEHGVEHIVLATGYCEEAVRAAMKRWPVRVSYCPNIDYDKTQNSMSLLGCEEAVAGEGFYKIDGDLLFDPRVLDRLDDCAADLAVAVDRRAKLGAEEMKVEVEAGSARITKFGKGLDPSVCYGESIGLERVSAVVVSLLFHGLSEAKKRGDTQLYYEDVYSELLGQGLTAEATDVSDLGWAEVDTPQDLESARRVVESMAATGRGATGHANGR